MKIMLSVLLLVAAAALVQAYEPGKEDLIVPVTVDLPVDLPVGLPVDLPFELPPVCDLTDDFTNEAATALLFKLPLPPKRCEDGPVYSIYSNNDEFFWPPIYKGSCEALDCGRSGSPCITRISVWKTKCVLFHKIINGQWVNFGFRTIRYLDAVECGCKQCSDITDHSVCLKAGTCPNNYYDPNNHYNPKSFCFWSNRGCDCCEVHSCPRRQYFNKTTCSCDCIKGTIKRGFRGGFRCLRPLSTTPLPTFSRPPHYYPATSTPAPPGTCKNQRSAGDCLRTRCSERRNSPYCVVDSYSKKCRCPECEDQKTPQLCLHTYCGPNQQCDYDKKTHQCFCPFKDYMNYAREY